MFLDLHHILLLMLMETVASLPQLKVNFEFMDSRGVDKTWAWPMG